MYIYIMRRIYFSFLFFRTFFVSARARRSARRLRHRDRYRSYYRKGSRYASRVSNCPVSSLARARLGSQSFKYSILYARFYIHYSVSTATLDKLARAHTLQFMQKLLYLFVTRSTIDPSLLGISTSEIFRFVIN